MEKPRINFMGEPFVMSLVTAIFFISSPFSSIAVIAAYAGSACTDNYVDLPNKEYMRILFAVQCTFLLKKLSFAFSLPLFCNNASYCKPSQTFLLTFSSILC